MKMKAAERNTTTDASLTLQPNTLLHPHHVACLEHAQERERLIRLECASLRARHREG